VNRRNLWVAWAIVVGAAFAIVAVTNASGIFYLVVAIIAGAGYSVIHMLTRKPSAGPGQPVPPGPGA
jgi:hypothetical protein